MSQIARYGDHDLEPLRAALHALSSGDFTRRPPSGAAAHQGVLGQIWPLVDAVATELAALNAEVARRAEQVRDIATVTTAVARGDLTRKVTVEVQGEMLQLKQTVNTMVDQLSAFADEVTRVAREVGTEGRLGGQAYVRGVSGVWKDLTESVNGLASNLTTQVRAIAAVASAVAEGDLTQSITVGARGEVAELKDNINLMVANLRETTKANREQDWLNTNLARLSSLMQGHRDPLEVARLILSVLTALVGALYGAFYLAADGPGADSGAGFERIAAYGFHRSGMTRFALGEGRAGQAALDRTPKLKEDAPPD